MIKIQATMIKIQEYYALKLMLLSDKKIHPLILLPLDEKTNDIVIHKLRNNT